MRTKNFARFGLFLNGELLDSGDMSEMMLSASRYAQKNPDYRYTISSMKFSGGEDVEVTEGTKIMKYTTINNEMYIINELV